MSTLKIKERIKREGFTVIDGENVIYYYAEINKDDPTNFSMDHSVQNQEKYKANRAICREDIAEFEDGMYALQDKLLAALAIDEEETVEDGVEGVEGGVE